MMARRKISTTVYLEPAQLRDLRALSDHTRVPQASMIREAVHQYLASRRSEIPPAEDHPDQTAMDWRDP
jgi:hypothetical protein